MAKGIDFSTGSIFQKLLLFSIPIILGELLQNLYNSADALIVGNYVGKTALAAVSVCSSPTNLIVGFFNGMSVGASAIVARCFGAGDQAALGRAMRVTFTFSAAAGVLLSLFGIAATPWLLQLTGAEGSLHQEAAAYLRIYLAGIMFTVIYNIGAGILRGIGNSRAPFYILTAACAINIGLDLLFVAALDLGTPGAALATVLSQGISVALVYRRLTLAEPGFHLAFGELRHNRALLLDMLGIGVPTGLQSSLIAISNLFVWRYINRFPAEVAAGIGVAQRLDKFIALPSKAFGATTTTFVAQTVGANDRRRSRDGVSRCMLLSMASVLLLGAVVYAFAGPCVSLFNRDATVVAVGVAMMRTIIPLYFTLAVREILLGALRGYGYTKVPMVLSLIGMIAVRQAYLAAAMALDPRVEHIFYCYPIAWIATLLLIAGCYAWKRNSLLRG